MKIRETPLVLGVGELLWDMLPDGKQCGGAPANVVSHLTRLGIGSAILSAVGDDAPGYELLDFLRSRKVCTDFIGMNRLRTGVVDVTLENGIPQYEIRRPAAWDDIVLPDSLRKILPRVSAAIFGTLAQRDPRSRKTIRELLKDIPDHALKIFDINLRQNFYDEEVIRSSLELADILKINEEELSVVSEIFGIPGDDRAVMTVLVKRFSLRCVILTLGAKGSRLFDGRSFSDYPVLPCKVVDTVGCGDSFLAAWCAAVLKGGSYHDAMLAGTELSAKVAGQHGAMF